MTTELSTTQPKASALATMAARYNVEPAKLLETLKNTAFKNATDAQMMALCVVANEYKLNPFTREIYAFPDKSGGIVPVIGVDGWFSMANNHSQFDGVEFEDAEDDAGNLIAIECRIYRKDRSRPTIASEYLEECRRNTDPWKTQPRRMLRHRAFIQCARIAFGISGADPEDIERISERQVVGRIVPVEQITFQAPAELPAPAQQAKKRGRPAKNSPPPNVAQGEPDARVFSANAGFRPHETKEAGDSFTLEAEPEYPKDGTAREQVEWLRQHHAIPADDLVAILNAMGVDANTLDEIPEAEMAKVVKSWDMVLDSWEGGAA